MLSRSVAASIAVSVAVSLVAGCGGGDERVVVFAASSLTDVLAILEQRFEHEHPGVDVVVSYGGSSTLATQIEQGAPADVFASADEANAARVAGARELVPFARNELMIAVEPGNPRHIESLADLARDDLVVVLAAPEVPAGAYAAQALAAAGVEVAADSYEQSVRAVVGKVALGEADAGIVYRTDVAASDEVDGVVIDAEHNVSAVYPEVVLSDRAAAQAFAEFLTGPEARTVLVDAGFDPP